jgi:hypothetical protein
MRQEYRSLLDGQQNVRVTVDNFGRLWFAVGDRPLESPCYAACQMTLKSHVPPEYETHVTDGHSLVRHLLSARKNENDS